MAALLVERATHPDGPNQISDNLSFTYWVGGHMNE